MHDFFSGLDPDTAPRNIKLMYYYFVGSRNLFSEMTDEAVEEFISDQQNSNVSKNAKFVYKDAKSVKREKLKHYGREKVDQHF